MKTKLQFLFFMCIALSVSACVPNQQTAATGGTETAPVAVIPITANRPITRVAVMTIREKDIPMEKANSVVIEKLIHKGYIVPSIADTNAVLLEQKRQDSVFNIYNKENAVKVGRMLNVDAIFVLELLEIRGSKMSDGHNIINGLSVVGRLVDAQSGSIIWIMNKEEEAPGLLPQILLLPVSIVAGNSVGRISPATAAEKMMAAFPPCNKVN